MSWSFPFLVLLAVSLGNQLSYVSRYGWQMIGLRKRQQHNFMFCSHSSSDAENSKEMTECIILLLPNMTFMSVRIVKSFYLNCIYIWVFFNHSCNVTFCTCGLQIKCIRFLIFFTCKCFMWIFLHVNSSHAGHLFHMWAPSIISYYLNYITWNYLNLLLSFRAYQSDMYLHMFFMGLHILQVSPCG